MKDRSALYLKAGSISTACLLCVCLCMHFITFSQPADDLTEQYGPELQMAYERYMAAVVIACETGDMSKLEESATGHALDSAIEIASYENAEATAEWWKVEVSSLSVKEYYTDTARVLIYERLIGDFSEGNAPGGRAMIAWLRKEDGVWRVYRYESPKEGD